MQECAKSYINSAIVSLESWIEPLDQNYEIQHHVTISDYTWHVMSFYSVFIMMMK